MKVNLQIVTDTPPDRAGTIRALLAELDQAEAHIAKVRESLAEQGRCYIAEKYPNAREFVRPSVERVRREVGG